jgi:hypothetical protein
MQGLGRLTDTFCTRDCTYRSTSNENAFAGRDFAKSMFIALTTMYPDMVFLLNKDAKLVQLEDGGGAVVLKVSWTGTREKMQPTGIVEDMHLRNGGLEFPDELLKDSKMTDADKQRIRTQFHHCKTTNQPFRLYGKTCYQFDLNTNNKVCGITCDATIIGLEVL